jgi:hypothetical protein
MFGKKNKKGENMADASNEFIEKNKKALLEELVDSMNSMSEYIATAVQLEPSKEDRALLRSILIGIARTQGYASAVLNQYLVLETGEIGEEKVTPIGFQSMIDENEKKKRDREKN